MFQKLKKKVGVKGSVIGGELMKINIFFKNKNFKKNIEK